VGDRAANCASQFAGQLGKAQGTIASGVTGLDDAAALISALSTTEGESAGERFNQAIRASVGGLGRGRAPQLIQDLSDEEIMKQGEYLKSIRASGSLGAKGILEKIADDLDSARKRYEAAGNKDFTEIEYLRSKGFGNDDDIRAVTQVANLRRRGLIGEFGGVKGVFTKLAEATPNANSINEKVQAFRAGPVAQARKGALLGEMGQVAQGAGPAEFYNELRKRAFETLKSEGREFGAYEDFDSSTSGWSPSGMARRQAVFGRMGTLVNISRAQAGLPVGADGHTLSPAELAKLNERAAGGRYMEANWLVDPGNQYGGSFTGTGTSAKLLYEAQAEAIRKGQAGPLQDPQFLDRQLEAATKSPEASQRLDNAAAKLEQLPAAFQPPQQQAPPPRRPLTPPGRPAPGGAARP
jgi:hypothetical protein